VWPLSTNSLYPKVTGAALVSELLGFSDKNKPQPYQWIGKFFIKQAIEF
jgi:hypothetical protein